MTVYLKSQMLERFHYNNSIRITPIVGVADLGWSITYKALFQEHPEYFIGGNHGFDNKCVSGMLLGSQKLLFFFNGAALKANRAFTAVTRSV